jgi:virulence factor Mce-like protein
MRFRSPTDLMSPVMVGAITVLVVGVAVFLSYNAGSSLPFTPAYNVKVQVPDAQELVPNNEVLVGGARVGVIDTIEPKLDENGDPYAELSLRLELELDGKLREDAIARVRARSLLGAKYLDIDLGTTGEPIATGGTLPLDRARINVEVDEVVDELDAPTRRNFARVIEGFGTGFIERGADVNATIASLRPLIEDARPVFAGLADPATQLPRLLKTYADVAAELGENPERVAGLIEGGARTLTALEDAGSELEEGLERSPETVAAGTEALAVLRPVLGKARVLTARLSPASKLLPGTANDLADAAEAGAPILRRARILPPLLDDTFEQLQGLAADEPSVPALDSLAGVLPELRPAVEFLAPYQTVCNYIAISARNLASTPSEGTASGNWLRFSAVIQPNEMFPTADPAPELHFNPYPNGAAPGQPYECEAGREPYGHGQVIGNVPGNQGLATDATTPESVAAVSD